MKRRDPRSEAAGIQLGSLISDARFGLPAAWDSLALFLYMGGHLLTNYEITMARDVLKATRATAR